MCEIRLFVRAKQFGIIFITCKRVKKFLAKQDAYTLYRPARRRFLSNRTFVHSIYYQWQADLAYLQKLEKYNDHKKYLLNVIYVFFKYALVIHLFYINSNAITKAFDFVLSIVCPRMPEKLQTEI